MSTNTSFRNNQPTIQPRNDFLPLKMISFDDFKNSDSFGGYRFFEDPTTPRNNPRKSNYNPNKLMIKMTSTTGQIVEGLLMHNGFLRSNIRPNIVWTGSHIKKEEYMEMRLNPYQKVNHFPNTVEITRKDRLYIRLSKMKEKYGEMEFGFIPNTYVLPEQREQFEKKRIANPSTNWIIKPISSSRGRGIYILGKDQKLGEDKRVVISKYIDDPLLIDEKKFDLRIYALVTSFDPLVVYIYNEGLARFATENYKSASLTSNRFVHLTNYSVNKLNKSKFVANEDSEKDGEGTKWSYSALRNYFVSRDMDFDNVIHSKIKDIVIKTVLSCKPQVTEGVRKVIPYKTNCFELFGFDIMFDSKYRPWLLEVNLSPSLTCDAPLDHKIKAQLVTDLFNMVGIVPVTLAETDDYMSNDNHIIRTNCGGEEALSIVDGEAARTGGWNRVYPSEEDHKYDQFTETQTPLNQYVTNVLRERRKQQKN
eukprot:TRINITY_DN8836_c0_g1_i1.p1 TRINITY_DN8836_c0_g1~~TRINITY_DN8836_c0_g1_i1.p1  ORF type:complete len:478 (-),score=101.84 TRINITY_DN8836_c0_g1_i1:31-1464(-)